MVRLCERVTLPGWARDYRLIDWLTQGYLALTGLLIVVAGAGRLPAWWAHVMARAAAIALIHLLIRRAEFHRSPLLGMLRAFYPMILYTFFYTETHRLDCLIFAGFFDEAFVRADQRLFGEQLSRTLMWRFQQLWVSEAMHAAYFSYYVMVFGTALGIYFRRRQDFFRYVTVVSFVFYVCYLIFIVFPVLGPHVGRISAESPVIAAMLGWRNPPASIRRGLFFRIMQLIYGIAESEGGGAFPSSHVAVAVATLWFTWQHFRWVRWAHLVAAVALSISTVYCGYHYAVDVLGGLAAAAVLVPAGHWLFVRYESGEGAVRFGAAAGKEVSALGQGPPPCP